VVDDLPANPRELGQAARPRWSPDASPTGGGSPATHRRQGRRLVNGDRGASVSGCGPPQVEVACRAPTVAAADGAFPPIGQRPDGPAPHRCSKVEATRANRLPAADTAGCASSADGRAPAARSPFQHERGRDRLLQAKHGVEVAQGAVVAGLIAVVVRPLAVLRTASRGRLERSRSRREGGGAWGGRRWRSGLRRTAPRPRRRTSRGGEARGP
jgi:hypothetical protein